VDLVVAGQVWVADLISTKLILEYFDHILQIESLKT